MGHSQSLRLGDVRRAFRLVGECRDLGGDRDAWNVRIAEGLPGLVGSSVVVTAIVEGLGAPPALWDAGWSSEGERALWRGYMAEARYLRYQTYGHLLRSPGRLRVLTRRQVITDREWYGGEEYNEDRRSVAQDDTLMAVAALGGPGGYHAYSLNRPVGDVRFAARDRALLKLFSEEVAALYGGHLSATSAGTIEGLPRRLREVLEGFALGDGEKQVALRLGLSRHTVHDYAKELHRRLGVGTRGELIAYYHRHRRGS